MKIKTVIRRRNIHPEFTENKNDLQKHKPRLSAKKQISLLSLMFITSIMLIVAGTALSRENILNKEKTVKSVSTLELDPSPTPHPTETLEPVITSWRNYSNDAYNFTIDIPSTWNSQEYIGHAAGGSLIAFSPEPLPCKTCTYFKDGYIAVKIFNRKTDPDAYAGFVQRTNAIGKNKEYLQVRLDKKQGVYHNNTVAVENQEWVYEISFDKDKGNANAQESELFQKVLSSFTFTSLVFDN